MNKCFVKITVVLIKQNGGYIWKMPQSGAQKNMCPNRAQSGAQIVVGQLKCKFETVLDPQLPFPDTIYSQPGQLEFK